jgi:hypothetical protein
MIGQIDPTAIAPYLAGPGAAVLVLLLVGAACYRLVVEHLVPMARTIAGRHLEQIDSMIAAQREESKAITKALSAIERSLGGVDRRLARLEGLTDGAGLIQGIPGAGRPDSMAG